MAENKIIRLELFWETNSLNQFVIQSGYSLGCGVLERGSTGKVVWVVEGVWVGCVVVSSVK